MGKRASEFKKRSDSSSQQRQHRPVELFLDRCLQCEAIIAALEKAGAALRLHRDYFSNDAPDAQWLPEVVKRGWICITKDKRIRTNDLERQCLLMPGSRSFVLTCGNMTGEEMAALLVKSLNKIERLARNQPTPFIGVISKTKVELLGR